MPNAKVQINKPADVPIVAATALGFIPENSLVVLGAPGPVARVDLDGVAALDVAISHWPGVVILAAYSPQLVDAARAIAEFVCRFPTVTVVDVVHVDPAGRVNGTHAPSDVVVPERTIHTGRTELLAEAGLGPRL